MGYPYIFCIWFVVETREQLALSMNSDNILVCIHILNPVKSLSATAKPLLNCGNIDNDVPCTDLLANIT